MSGKRERGGNEKAEGVNGETGSCKIERRGTFAQRGRGSERRDRKLQNRTTRNIGTERLRIWKQTSRRKRQPGKKREFRDERSPC